jgi:hypothetical protein
VLLCSEIFAAAMGTLFSSTMTPAQSAASAADTFAAVIPHKSANSAAIRTAERMLYRGTAADCCAARFLKGLAAAILVRDQKDFLRRGFARFLDFSFRPGFDGLKIQAGESLAGKDSWEASSTGSRVCERSVCPRVSRSSGFGGEDSRFSAGLPIRTQFFASRAIRRNTWRRSSKLLFALGW